MPGCISLCKLPVESGIQAGNNATDGFIHTTKSIQSGFDKAPEAFNAVDMARAAYKFILPMIDSRVLAIADIDQPVVTAPAIGIDDANQGGAPSNNPLQRGFSAVRNDFCADATVAFENTKDRLFTVGTMAPLTFAVHDAEIRFIDLNLPTERRLELAIPCIS